MIEKIGLVILATLTPISELRGGIPLGLYLGLDPLLVFFLSVFFNSLVFFPVYFCMKFLYKNFFSKISLFKHYLKKQKRAKPYIEKYGPFGLLLFVAIPLPMTGAYTASLISWLFGIEWKKAFLVVVLGVFIAGMIILGISLGFLT
jgi:uncharacterized membrane protein